MTPRSAKPQLAVDLAGLKLRNPTILASGIVGTTVSMLSRVYEAGAGAVISKSVSLRPREGYVSPTIVEVDGGYLNAIGLSNPGVDEFIQELNEAKPVNWPIIASVFGGASKEFSETIKRLDKMPVQAFELNLSCPHVEGVGLEIGQDPALTKDVVRAAKNHTSKPVIAKINAGVTDPVEIAVAAEKAGADAITAINTLRAMTIDIETGRPLLANKIGGLSGPALKPIAIRCVYEVSQNVKIPVIGSGGICSWKDTVEFLLAGATAVQIGTVLSYKNLDIFNEVTNGILEYLATKKYRSVKEIVGLSHSY